jgi:hypothetical protein
VHLWEEPDLASDLAPAEAMDVIIIDKDLPRLWSEDPVNALEKRRLTGTVRPQYAKHLALLDTQGDAIEYNFISLIAKGEALYAQLHSQAPLFLHSR